MSRIDKLYTTSKNKDGKIKEDDESIITIARERARDGASYWSKNWEDAEDDLNFLAGDQWPAGVRNAREMDQRPCLTNNVLPTFVDQVLGDQRQNRPSIKVSPVETQFAGSGSEQKELTIPSLDGKSDYKLGEILTGLIKNIEYSSDAETSYDIAFQSALQSGMGYLRVLADYACEEGFEQDLSIDHIENQFAVIIDPAAREHDKSDMMWCFIDEDMRKSEFEQKHPNASTDAIRGDQDNNLWFSENTVRVSEYFTREAVIREQALLSDGRAMYLDEIEPIVDELLESGISIVRTRKTKTYEVYWRKITGSEVLEGPIKTSHTTIPIVPVWGKTLQIKKKIKYLSLIRYAKDAQRMANYWDSAATEVVSLTPKTPYIASEGQIEDHPEWQNANQKNYSVLTYTAQSPGDTGPRRQPPATVPAAELTLGQTSVDKIKATLGMFDASIGAQGNETSGRAILARQRESDTGSFAFIDNLSKSIRRVGKLLIEAIPYYYDTERIVRIKFEDESEALIKINQQVYDEETEEFVTVYDLNVAKYDVVVKTGPAYSTQRVEAVEAMLQFAQAVPQAAAVMMDLMAQNMDWPGADVIAERLKKILPPHVLSASEKEEIAKDAPPPAEPTPEQQASMAESEASIKESEAKIATAQSDTIKTNLEAAQAQRELNDIQNGGLDKKTYEMVKEMVATAIAEMMTNKAISPNKG